MRRILVSCAFGALLVAGCGGKAPSPDPAPAQPAAAQTQPRVEPPPKAPEPVAQAAALTRAPAPQAAEEEETPAAPAPVEKPQKSASSKTRAVEEHKSTTKQKAAGPSKGGSVTTRDMFVRTAPSKSGSEVIMALRAGTRVTRQGQRGEWVKISFDDPKGGGKKTGWIWQEAFAR
jgi:outer membrane biosynthesis protein TonB